MELMGGVDYYYCVHIDVVEVVIILTAVVVVVQY